MFADRTVLRLLLMGGESDARNRWIASLCCIRLLEGLLTVASVFSAASCLMAQSVSISTFPVANTTGIVGITKGPDGAVWFTNPSASKVGRMTPNGSLTEYAVPVAVGPITLGPDGALWFAESYGVGRITTAGVVSPEIVAEPFLSGGPAGITAGPDGALWVAYNNLQIGRITMSGGTSTVFLSAVDNRSTLRSIAAGPDGALWFTIAPSGTVNGVLGPGNAIGRITTSGVVTVYNVPTPNSAPTEITQGPDGAMWFTEINANKIGRITTAGVFTEYPTQGSSPRGITAGPDGALWFTEVSSKIGRITTNGVVTEYDHSLGGGGDITTGPDGSVWFGGYAGIGRLTINASARSGVLSHIAAGGGWSTVIALVNNSSMAVPLTVAFHNDDGSALSLPVTTTLLGATLSSTTASVSAIVNPNATLLINTGQLTSTVVGWADVTSTGPVGGYAIFRQTPQTGSPSEGTEIGRAHV